MECKMNYWFASFGQKTFFGITTNMKWHSKWKNMGDQNVLLTQGDSGPLEPILENINAVTSV